MCGRLVWEVGVKICVICDVCVVGGRYISACVDGFHSAISFLI